MIMYYPINPFQQILTIPTITIAIAITITILLTSINNNKKIKTRIYK
jgi:hypothetical protein